MNMKRIIVFCACTLLLWGMTPDLLAQRFKGELIAGFNATQVEGDEVFGFKKFGGNLGMGVMLPFSFHSKQADKNWAVSMEMLFHQKGSHQRNNTGVTYAYTDSGAAASFYDSFVKYDLRLNYVSIPLMIHYQDARTGWTFGAGVAYNRLFSVKEVENGYWTETTLSSGTYSLQEFSVLFDVRFRIYRQLKFDFRYEYSLFPIRTRTFYKKEGVPVDPYDRKQYNNVLTFRLVYMFNERQDAGSRSKRKSF